MSIPYRRTPRAETGGCAAFLLVVWSGEQSRLFGGMLLVDGRGQPVEFVHTSLKAPTGFLWPAESVRRFGTVEVVHSLFGACQREPQLVACQPSLGPPNWCRDEIAPSIPFAMVSPPGDDELAAWSWLNDPPAKSMPAFGLWESLVSRGFALEPFDRVAKGLHEVYPEIGDISADDFSSS